MELLSRVADSDPELRRSCPPSSGFANVGFGLPVVSFVRNGALLIWDMLYSVNEKLEPQPQMVEGHEVDDDGLEVAIGSRLGADDPGFGSVESRVEVLDLLGELPQGRLWGSVLAETLDSLEMPRSGLRKWFQHNRDFCNAHGGRRIYSELLDLLGECDAALARMRD